MKKYISVAIGCLVLIGGYFISKAFINNSEGAPKPKPAKVVTTVFVQTVKNATLPVVVQSTGSLMAKDRIELFSEVQGLFKSSGKTFKPGVYYTKGETLLTLEATEQYASLQAQKSTLYNQIATALPDLRIDFPESFSQWEEYARNFDVDKPLKDLPAPRSDKEKVFISSKNIYTTYYNIASLALRLDKYVIKAPFSGMLTEASITPGTLVRPGQKLGEFISSGVYEMEVAIGVSFLPSITIGKKVEVKSLAGTPQTWQGTVVRINNKVDRASQTATVYLQLQGNNLAEGMYLEAIIDARQEANVFEIDRNLLIEGNRVFAVNDTLLTFQEVSAVHFKKQTVLVKGLKDGQKILAKSIPSAYEGMEVKMYEE